MTICYFKTINIMKQFHCALFVLACSAVTTYGTEGTVGLVARPDSGIPPTPSATSVATPTKFVATQVAQSTPQSSEAKTAEQSAVEPPKKAESQAEEAKKEKPARKRLGHLGSLSSQKIPGQPWRIHDALRPRPAMVTPGKSDSLPPSDAIVLFDGTDLSNWCHRGGADELFEPEWKIVDGCLEVEPRSGSLYTIESYASCQLHIEWMIPEGTTGVGQGRGNSGIKLMERFEVQVLESFGSKTYADGQAGAIYGQYPPLVNAVRQPGQWQSYDIFFQAPKFEDERLVRPAAMTVVHNGVLVQMHRVLPGPTGAREPKYSPLQPAAPIMLQDHGNKIRFRNIWLRSLPD